jgi:hypothetical protein
VLLFSFLYSGITTKKSIGQGWGLKNRGKDYENTTTEVEKMDLLTSKCKQRKQEFQVNHWYYSRGKYK